MQPPIPEWINTDFLTQCLQKELGQQSLTVTNFDASHAAPPGNNYGSVVIRVKVEYKNSEDDSDFHSMSLIVKSEHSVGPMAHLVELIEPMFYNKFLPEARKIMDTSFAPRSYLSPIPSVIVLEDLKESGFLLADRTKQLDFDHCRLYMEVAASFHAGSFAIHKTDPELVESLGKEKMFTEKAKAVGAMKKMVKTSINCLADAVEDNARFKKYGKVIRKIAENYWEVLCESHKPVKVFNTIGQGDPWTANMMFKYSEDGKVEEVKLFDFQMLRFSSPITDLLFFLWTSANPSVRRNGFSDLLVIYLNAFNKKLQQLNCTERMTKEMIFDEVKRLSVSTLNCVSMIVPFQTDPEPVKFDVFFEEGTEAGEKLFKSYYNKTYCSTILPEILQDLESAGVFDNLENRNKSLL